MFAPIWRSPLAAALLLLMLNQPAQAVSHENEAPGGALDLDTAAALALVGHPDLARFVFDRAAIDGRRLQASLRPNPEIGIELDNFAGNDGYRKLDSAEATLRLQLVLERSDKRTARMGVSDAQRDRLDGEFELARLDVLADTTRRFIDVAETQAHSELADRAVSYAQQALAAAQRRVQAGAASSLEINRARIALERAELEREHHEHQLAVQRRQLAAQWNEQDLRYPAVRADLLALPASDDYADLLLRLRRSPDFVHFDLDRRLREAELGLARSQALGDPTLSAGVRRLQQAQDNALLASLLIPLPVRNRNQGAIAEAIALRDRSEVERQAAMRRSEVALFGLVQELHHGNAQVEALRQVLIPQAHEAWTLTQRGYANGRYSQIDLLDAQRTLLELESELLINAADYHRTLAAIERMTALAADARTGNTTP
jgi:cobalt-zinc-cadmium efflux system outer membrane protein